MRRLFYGLFTATLVIGPAVGLMVWVDPSLPYWVDGLVAAGLALYLWRSAHRARAKRLAEWNAIERSRALERVKAGR